MSGGRTARGGFAFQDLLQIQRMVRFLVRARAAEARGEQRPSSPSFSVENSVDGTSEPEWDLVQEGTRTVAEEVKSGAVEARDRRALWRRVRKTLESSPGSRLIVRLAIDSDNPPDNLAYWRALSSESKSATPANVPRVTSAERLAQEALYLLTAPDDGASGAPLSQDKARELLADFELFEEFGRQSLRAAIERDLGLLSVDLGVRQLRELALGFVGEKALAESDAERRFTADDFLSHVQVLDRIAHVERTQAKLLSSMLSPAPDRPAKGGLDYRDWRAVQPHAADSMAVTPALAAIVGAGGLGKSVVIQQLGAEARAAGDRVAVLRGADLAGLRAQDLEAALGLGAFLADVDGSSLLVTVDGLEHAPNPAAVVGALSRTSRGGTRIVVACREVTWRGFRDPLVKRWQTVRLEAWDSAHVLQALGDETADPALVEVLSSPLLLDLYLRLPGREPSVARNRTALLTAYWESRVFGAGLAANTERRSLLLEICERESEGLWRHHGSGHSQAASELCSEGVFEPTGAGQFAFRHDLLRDYAMAWWVLDASGVDGRLARLRSIQRGRAQWGAVREVLSRLRDNNGGLIELQDLLGRCLIDGDTRLRGAVADALAELPANVAPKLSTLEQILAGDGRMSTTLGRVLDGARLHTNRSWLRWLSELPDDVGWAERQPWLDDGMLLKIAALSEVLDRQVKDVHDRDLAAVAQRLRNWSSAPKFEQLRTDVNGGVWRSLIRTAFKHAATDRTLAWASSLTSGWHARLGILDELPTIAGRGRRLDSTTLLNVFLAAAGLVEVNGVYVSDVGAPPLPNGEYSIIEKALLSKGRGLLYLAPESFVSVAAGLVAGSAEERLREWRVHLAAIATALPAPPTSEAPATKYHLARDKVRTDLLPAVPAPSKFTPLVRDAGIDGRGQALGPHYQHLRQALGSLFDRDPAGGDLRGSFLRPVLRSRSALARHLLLGALIRRPQHHELLDEILFEERAYHEPSLTKPLHEAIKVRWRMLTPGGQHRIKNLILGTVRSEHCNGVYVAGRLAMAVPDTDRSEELGTLVGVAELAPPPVAGEGATEVTWGAPTPQWPRVDAMSKESLAKWRELAGVVYERTPVAGREILRLVESVLNEDLPNPRSPQDSWVLSVVRDALAGLRRTDPEIRPPRELLSRLAEWTLGLCEVLEPYDALRDGSGDESGQEPDLDSPYWRALRATDEILARDEMRGAATCRSSLLAELHRLIGGGDPVLIGGALSTIRAYNWACTIESRELLESALDRQMPNSGIRAALWLLRVIPYERHIHILSTWIQEMGSLPNAGTGLREIGEFVGVAAVHRDADNEALPHRDWALSFPSVGPLADNGHRARFAAAITFGAKDALLAGNSTLDDFASLATRMAEVRETCMGVEDDGFVIFLLHPLAHALEGKEHHHEPSEIWARLQPIVQRLMATGAAQDVHAVVFALRERAVVDELGSTTLSPLLSLAADRARSEEDITTWTAANSWCEILNYVCELAGHLAEVGSQEAKELVHECLQEWADRGHSKALETLARVRST